MCGVRRSSPVACARRSLLGAALLAGCLWQTGCAQNLVALRREPYSPLAERLNLTARGGPKPSPRTAQLLRRYDLARLARRPHEQLAALEAIHDQHPTAETCYALAELSYLAGWKLELHQRRHALGFYWNAVTQSYAYLFDPVYAPARNPYDPQFRGACDLYNGALENCLRIAQREGLFRPGESIVFEMAGRQLSVSITPVGFGWKPHEFERFEFVSDYDLKGLPNRYQTFGLGVPLIAVRRRCPDSPPEVERYYAEGLSFPVTAFLRVDEAAVWDRSSRARTGPALVRGESDDLPAAEAEVNRADFPADDVPQPVPPAARNLLPKRTATLELYDPLETTHVKLAGTAVPLESDISTPLAHFLDHPRLRHLDTLGLFFPAKVREASGLYMVQPYQPDKIPVLMVHGLWSSPMTWMEMFNDLRADPEIRRRYQFWFYLYPTGQPFWESAAQLRRDLAEVRRVFDPDGNQPELDDMIIVGHSMGGLIARLVTLEGGDPYWNAVSRTPIEQVSAGEEVRGRLREMFYFDADDSVSRIVTIGSPHRGSNLANRWARLASHYLITLPRDSLERTVELLTQNPAMIDGEHAAIHSTSIDTLAPNSPILQVMNQSPRPAHVKHHNIVGNLPGPGPLQGSDGVVPFDSAHLDDVDSETVVPAHHSRIHRHPATVLTVHEILRAHLRERDAQNADRLRHADAEFPAPVPAK